MLTHIKQFARFCLKKIFLLTIRPFEHTWANKLKYLYFKHGSSILVIIFSGLDDKNEIRKYNYVKGLRNIKTVDFLFLSDPYGYRGSYYWKELGSDSPYYETQSLIKQIVNGGRYSNIITMGTSK